MDNKNNKPKHRPDSKLTKCYHCDDGIIQDIHGKDATCAVCNGEGKR